MKSDITKQIFAVLLISCLNLQSSLGQHDEFQLQLGEIDTDEVQLKAAGNNEYVLKISQPDNQLLEKISVESSVSTDPVITKAGELIVNYPDENLYLALNYKADGDGYRASYTIGRGQREEVPLDFGVRLNIKDLKSLTG